MPSSPNDFDGLKDALDGVELTAPWTDRMRRDCPMCGGQLEITPGLSTTNAARAYCPACGFSALMTPPREDWDNRWGGREPVGL